LPNVFYVGDPGLALVVRDGPKNIVNTNADVQGDLNYLKANTATATESDAKALESGQWHALRLGTAMLRLILAVVSGR
jgi:hypothetical protein